MCIDLEGHHFGGSSFVNLNDFFIIEIVHMNEKTGTGVSFEKEPVNESPSR